MSVNRYRAAGASHMVPYEVGDEFEADWPASVEQQLVAAGVVEILPAAYEVVGGSTVLGHPPGSTFEEALPAFRRDLLIEGGHIAAVKRKTTRKAD